MNPHKTLQRVVTIHSPTTTLPKGTLAILNNEKVIFPVFPSVLAMSAINRESIEYQPMYLFYHGAPAIISNRKLN
jgi:hypothetical protein